MEPDALQKQADHCNDRRMASKRVQELSIGLFFSILVKVSVQPGPFFFPFLHPPVYGAPVQALPGRMLWLEHCSHRRAAPWSLKPW